VTTISSERDGLHHAPEVGERRDAGDLTQIALEDVPTYPSHQLVIASVPASRRSGGMSPRATRSLDGSLRWQFSKAR
jgi:hypothetical protein